MNSLIDNWPVPGVTYRDAFVLLALWRKAQYKTNRLVKVSRESLASLLEIPISGLSESINRLEMAGYLERHRGGRGRATEYLVKCPENPDTDGPENPDTMTLKGPENPDGMCPENPDTFQKSSHCPAKYRLDAGYSHKDSYRTEEELASDSQ